MANKNLIAYLENIIALEKDSYIQGQMITRINQKIETLGNHATIKRQYSPRVDFKDDIEAGLGLGIIGGAIIGLIYGFFTGSGFFGTIFEMIGCGFLFGIGGVGVGFVIGLVIYFYEKSAERKNDAYYYQEYLDEKAEDNRRVQMEKEQIKQLDELRDSIVKARVKTVTTLGKYYQCGALYETYRNFAAVCSICEYLKSGKCSVLEGHEGAYVLYDTERRLDKILDKIDDVVEHLNQIKSTQFMLYSAIQEGNRKTDRLLEESYRQTELLQYNTEQNEIIAYNTQCAVNAINYQNWLLSTKRFY